MDEIWRKPSKSGHVIKARADNPDHLKAAEDQLSALWQRFGPGVREVDRKTRDGILEIVVDLGLK